MTAAASFRASRHPILEGQALHLVFLVLALAGLAALSSREGFAAGALWGLETRTWFWLAIWVPVAHQVYVWLCWRTELHAGWLTRAFGGRAFAIYGTLFAVIGIARIAVMFPLAYADRGSLAFGGAVLQVLAVVAAVPALYLFYSVKRYFTFTRAFGIDHFDAGYRTVPFVRKGIFRFTSNGMYVYGFLMFWVPGLWYGSEAALWAALFNHIYIWVHYYATERPDMARIYGGAAI